MRGRGVYGGEMEVVRVVKGSRCRDVDEKVGAVGRDGTDFGTSGSVNRADTMSSAVEGQCKGG